MRRFLVALPLLALLLSVLAVAQQAPRPRPLTREGLRTAELPRRYQPPSPSASAAELETQGDQFRGQKAYGDAIDYYRTALVRADTKPRQATLYNKIGIAELQLQHFNEAQKNFQRAIKCNRKFGDAYNNLGATAHLQKKYAKAMKEYRKALALDDNNASYHSNLGTAYFMHKDYPLALEQYRRALELDPDVFERHSEAGVSAQLSSPENRAQYNFFLAKLFAQGGNFERSIEYLKKAMEDGYKQINDVYKDESFAGLRQDPRFVELMAQKPPAIPE